jgi:hypothetical protein
MSRVLKNDVLQLRNVQKGVQGLLGICSPVAFDLVTSTDGGCCFSLSVEVMGGHRHLLEVP